VELISDFGWVEILTNRSLEDCVEWNKGMREEGGRRRSQNTGEEREVVPRPSRVDGGIRR